MIQKIHIEGYPETLRNMKSPPKHLYIRGALPLNTDQKYVCIVGSRKSTEYGKMAAKKIISGLKGYPISIVSGLAFGIDSIAHQAALEAGLHCIALPGSSLEWDEIYPQKHIRLAEQILDTGGALVSEWESQYPTGRWAFPARNRLMAGLSHTVLIVEAAHKSGSLMTAKHAEEFNRDVLAIPGPIDSPKSYGPHMLIKNGAALVSDSFDVLEALGFEITRPANYERESQQIKEMPDYIAGDPLASRILQILGRQSLSVDFIIEMTGTNAQTLNERLTLLELEGLIRIEGTSIIRSYS